MTSIIKAELVATDPEEWLPQNLPPKWLTYVGMRVNDFLDEFNGIASDDATNKIRIDPDILDIVTKIYVAVNGDHEVDTSDIQNIIAFQEAIHTGAIYYCLAVFRESLGRESQIAYEQPALATILTKPPETYDCHDLMDWARKHNCQSCSGCG